MTLQGLLGYCLDYIVLIKNTSAITEKVIPKVLLYKDNTFTLRELLISDEGKR